MRQDRPVEWTSENVTAFWDFELKFPDRYFTYHNADGMIKRLGKYIAQSEAILDYGCGTGLLLARLAEQGHRVAGSDTSEQSLEATRHRLQGYDTFLGAFTPDALLAEGRQFDTILAVELVEHLHDDWLDHALGNLRRLLEPNGRIIVTTPNQERAGELVAEVPVLQNRLSSLAARARMVASQPDRLRGAARLPRPRRLHDRLLDRRDGAGKMAEAVTLEEVQEDAQRPGSEGGAARLGKASSRRRVPTSCIEHGREGHEHTTPRPGS